MKCSTCSRLMLQKELQQLVDNLNKVTHKFGIKISVKKPSDVY